MAAETLVERGDLDTFREHALHMTYPEIAASIAKDLSEGASWRRWRASDYEDPEKAKVNTMKRTLSIFHIGPITFIKVPPINLPIDFNIPNNPPVFSFCAHLK